MKISLASDHAGFEYKEAIRDGALWIMTKDGQQHPEEMQVLREHVEQRARASWVYRFLSWRFA